jgi:DNA-binding NtrC family response regulator/tetratricopeptide (TPR) repeat protein
MSDHRRASLDEPLSLIRRGRFAEACSFLKAHPFSSGHDSFAVHQALLSDMLQRTGNNEEAELIASRFAKTSLSSEVLGRFHYVLGNVNREKGRLAEAVSQFRAAARLTEGDPELCCWAQLRLMSSIGDMAGPETAMARLDATRASLIRFGEKRPFSALHLWIAECETVRGKLDSARHHLRIAESLLLEIEDAWLHGYLAINSFGVCFYSGEIAEAQRWATVALECSALSGHKGARRAAYANAGAIEFSVGHLEKAEELLRLALADCHTGSTNHIAVLHSLALVTLQRDDTKGCSAIVALIDSFSNCDEAKSAYYRAWAVQTKIRFLLKQGLNADAKRVCEGVPLILEKLTTARASTNLRLLTVETLIANGDLPEAACALRNLLSDTAELPLDVHAEIERVLSKTFYCVGSRLGAQISLTRALESFEALGHVVGKQQTVAEGHDYSTVNGRATRFDVSRSCVDRIRTLLDTRKRPEMFGRESIRLLRELDCVDGVALTSNDAGNRAVLFSIGSEVHQKTPRLTQIELGGTTRHRLRLEYIAKSDASSVLTVGIFERLIKSIASLNATAACTSDTDLLWPSDEWIPNEQIVLVAKSMTEVLGTISKAAPTKVSMLLTGETGTGKEVLAKVIHERSRRGSAFVAFNCAAVPKDLIESQLFGYKRGAFSGAIDAFSGVIRAADGGTLLLDEIGELPLDIQPKLLRFIDSGEVHPLGETRPVHVDVRLLFATNVDLETAVAQGRFREDLFFRINVIPLCIPPLRERREEIPLLTNLFAHRFSRELSKDTPKIDTEAMESLVLYRWPGNIRQLSNEVRRVITTAEDGAVITRNHLSQHIRVDGCGRSSSEDDVSISLKLNQGLSDAVNTLEREMIEHALKLTHGQVTEAARSLGLSRKGLYLKRQRLAFSRSRLLHS